ncbi:FAD-binding oxidoreductase [Sagittula sp. NFXS13]|uniref:NAD(P)/FAD-dependent oxidoreductase n=1 Tax=Sagittula sp. NFXS13 TaxID=2819095 RepID=UPI0032DE8E81
MGALDGVLWDRTAESVGSRDDMRTRCDVAVVGGGFTGLSVALFAAQAGLSVQVLEAGRVGAGGSGRNVGLVNAGLWLPPAELEQALGPAFLSLFADAPGVVFDLIERHQIRCEARRDGTLHAAHAVSGMKGLAARHDAWAARGAPVSLLNSDAMAEAVGTRAFAGGLLDRRAGTVNPMGYARGLARAARSAGARVAEETPVSGLSRDGSGWRVDTAQGAVLAKTVVLATNAYSAALRPEVAQCFSTIRFQQLATPPLGAQAAHILPGGQGLWDTGLVMRSLRKDAVGRLIVGTMGRLDGDAALGASRQWAARTLRRWFPELGDVTFEAAWDGQIAMTPDHLPRILKLDQGLYCPIGYNGRGITTGTVFGRALAELLAGGDPQALPLSLSAPSPVRMRRLRGGMIDLAAAVKLRL